MIKSIPYIALIVLLLVITVPLLSGFINRKSESSMEEGYKKATFAGGCFWCMEPPFEELKGVIDVVAGYSGGEVEDPSYGEVASGNTDHREAVQITYDPEEISYGELLDIYWNHTDPTD